VTAQGSAHGRFERALRNRQVFQAELAARELGALPLIDALRLVALYSEAEPETFSRPAARWLSRFVNEAGLDLLAAQLALSALMLLPGAERQRGVGVAGRPRPPTWG
jgi:hypothetical protein